MFTCHVPEVALQSQTRLGCIRGGHDAPFSSLPATLAEQTPMRCKEGFLKPQTFPACEQGRGQASMHTL